MNGKSSATSFNGTKAIIDIFVAWNDSKLSIINPIKEIKPIFSHHQNTTLHKDSQINPRQRK